MRAQGLAAVWDRLTPGEKGLCAGRLPPMEPQIVVSLASTGVAALAVMASLITTLLTVRTQRDNTRSTLATQERLSVVQERLLRERAHEQDLRDKRTAPYLALLGWAERLLAALDDLDEASKPFLTLAEWHIVGDVDLLLDLYASDTIHIRYAALRGRMIGLVESTDEPRCPQIVTWDETSGEVGDVRIEAGPAWRTWRERAAVVPELMSEAIALITQVRAEMQGRPNAGYYIIWRLS